MENSQRFLNLAAAALAVWTALGPRAYGQPTGQDPVREKIAPKTAALTPPKLWERVEISVFGGLGISIARWTTIHYSEAGISGGPRISAENRIRTTTAPDIFAGAGATFFLRSGVGIQAGFGYLKSGLTCANAFRYQAPGLNPASYAASFQGEGELTAVPVFLCIFNKMDIRLGSKRLRAYLAAGPLLSLNSVFAEVRGGAAALRDEKADAFVIPVAVADTTWISFGATAAAGLDIPLSTSLALTVEGRYYYSRRKNFSWHWAPATVDGLFGEIPAFNFDAEAAGRYDRDTSYLTIDPSFIQLACGLKLIF